MYMAYSLGDKKINLIVFTLLQLFIFTYGIIIFLINYSEVSDFKFSLYYVILSIASLILCWFLSERKLNLFFLYLVCFHLFIGGRFYVCIFDTTLSPFETTFFFDYKFSKKWIVELLNYVYSCVFFLVIGYYLSKRFLIKKIANVESRYINPNFIKSIGGKLFWIIGVILLYMGIKAVIYSFQHGYAYVEELVTNQVYNVSLIEKLAPMLLIFFLAITFCYTKDLNKRYLMLYGVYGIILLISGTRAAFASALLLGIWLYSMDNKISLFRIILFIIIGLCFLLIIFSLTSRGTGLDSFSLLDGIKIFFYTNGVSLMVFDACRLIDNYPTIGYVQTFIPGATLIYSKIQNGVSPQDAMFSNRLCYELNPDLFANGAGLGWTTLSDFYVFASGNIFYFCIFAVILGWLMGTLESWSKSSIFYKFLVISITQNVLMMPRGLLSSFFIQIIYSFMFYIILHNIAKYKYKIVR